MKNKKQFTLIELIIVIVVIGILAAMALPKFNGVVRGAKLSAMINDKETLEKALVMYYQKNDELPILEEEQEFIAKKEGINLTKIVLAEENQSDDMNTIYTSLKETLKHYEDNEDTLYRIDLSKLKNNLSKKIKYGYKKHDKDFYVYSMKTGNVYYYDYIINQNGTIQHDEYDTLLRKSELISKEKSPTLDDNEVIINNAPIIELITDVDSITIDSLIKWEYTFTDEDEKPTKISFILNDVEYDSFENIPTKLNSGEYSINLKMQDSKGLWSNEIIKTFKIEKPIEQSFKDVVYVNESVGLDASSNGTKEKPYKTFEYALKNVKNNGSIYLDGRITLDGTIDFDNYKKNVNFIGDYKNKGSEFFMPEYFTSKHSFYTRDYKVTFNGIKISNNRTSSWGETFAYSNNITINNCIVKENSEYSNVYGEYVFNNCVIERIGYIHSPTTFNNCVFLKNKPIVENASYIDPNLKLLVNNYLENVTLNKDYNIISNHTWINAGVDENGNKTNIGVYGGKYPWK